eukprot:4240739-Pyramimonas_sp.AAC.1
MQVRWDAGRSLRNEDPTPHGGWETKRPRPAQTTPPGPEGRRQRASASQRAGRARSPFVYSGRSRA